MSWSIFGKKDDSTSEKKSVSELENLIRASSGGNQLKSSIQVGNGFESYAEHGYMNTVAVYYCLTTIAGKAGTVPIKLFQKAQKKEDRTEIYSHPILDLIRNPAPNMDWETFLEQALSYYYLSGDIFYKPIKVNDQKVHELQLVSPKGVEFITNAHDTLQAYDVTVNGKKKRHNINRVSLTSDIKHMHSFDPLHPYKGMSVLKPAATVVDILNSGDAHNFNVLKNQAKPSGAFSYEPADGSPAYLEEEAYERLKQEIETKHTGEANAGKPLLLEGGLKWIQMSMSARDLDYLNSRGVSQKDVCRAFKVPPVLLGLDNDSTYNNVREARLGLWDDAIAPVLKKFINHINKHIVPMFADGEGLELVLDFTEVADLETRNERIWKRIDGSDFVTINEKRNMLGLDPIDGADTVMISSGDMPLDLLERGIQASNINEIVSAGAAAKDDGKPKEKEVEKPKSKEVKKSFEMKSEQKGDLYEVMDAITIGYEKKLAKVVIPFMEGYGDIMENAIEQYQEIGAESALLLFSDRFAQKINPIMADVIETFGEMTLKGIERKSDGRFLYKDDLFDETLLVSDVVTAQEATTILLSSEWARRVNQYVEKEAVFRAKFIEKTTRDSVKKILADGIATGKTYVEMAKEANLVLSNKARSMKIVATEVHNAREFGSYEAAKATGLDIKKEWLSSADERTRTSHVVSNGQVVAFSKKFRVGGTTLDHPGDPMGSAKEIINCRCTCLYHPL